ncbi:MAG: hypothetical protein F4X54_01520, partial [Chloroflexi bacterium]|nr:hypothetical protein [Chloroflexota bacterium]
MEGQQRRLRRRPLPEERGIRVSPCRRRRAGIRLSASPDARRLTAGCARFGTRRTFARSISERRPMHDDPWEHGHYGAEDEVIFGSIAEDGFPINPDWLRLTSVGIDIGSSTSHLMFSKLVMRRRSTEMSSEFEVVFRQVLYRSPILLTPYSDPDTIDTDSLGEFVKQSYAEAELEADDIDTGAVICTGEAVRKHNSEAIIRMLAAAGGRFVCATAGPNLEGILGAHGSGAAARSLKIGAGMNVDMGGGTTKIA